MISSLQNKWILGFLSILLGMMLSTCSSNDSGSSNITVQERIPFYNSTILLISKSHAVELLGESDEFTKTLSKFDVQSRLASTTIAGTEQEYIDYAVSQSSDWTQEEIQQLKDSIKVAESRLKAAGINLNKLPSIVEFLKSTCNEEYGAEGYTRADYVVLKSINPGLIAHELFHIYTRYNQEQVDNDVISVFGYKKATNQLAYPSDLIKVTNPDAPFYQSYINVVYQGATIKVTPLIYSISEYKGPGTPNTVPIADPAVYVQGVANPTLAKVEQINGVWQFSKDVNGKTITFPFDKTNIMSIIGNNTFYVFHPYEMAATYMEMIGANHTSNLPTPSLMTSYINAFK